MRSKDVPNFVSDILAAGAPMWAIGEEFYLICESEVPKEAYAKVASAVQAVCNRYGPREHLRREIAAHLRSLGRYVDLDERPPAHELH